MLRKIDYAHQLLVPFIEETEHILKEALLSLDSSATCKITAAPDLGFPHDVVRLAGGFPTGVFVEWDCSVPFVPVDTTVNIDTSSVFVLKDNISSEIDKKLFAWLRGKIEKESSYLFNFHKGNHFISFGKMLSSGDSVLVIHSNEKEFKYQFNGLMPKEGNWYMDSIKTLTHKKRYIRYLQGEKASLFIDIAKSLEEFNIIRHRFIANILVEGKTKIVHQNDYHHYYMPNRQSVAIGCFPVQIGESVPIFSRPGRNIDIFKVKGGGLNSISGNNRVLVPHGWGKTCKKNTNFEINARLNQFKLGDNLYKIKTLVSMGGDENLSLRDFSSNFHDENSFFKQMEHYCPGDVVESIVQEASFTKNGFLRHQ